MCGDLMSWWSRREETERAGELQSTKDTSELPSGALASGAEGVKESIQGFGEARKADIINERLPPDLIDADGDAPASPLQSNPPTPNESPDVMSPHDSPALGTPGSPSSLGSGGPESPPPTSWKPGHGRRTSLGTTGSSPSTRRRSLDMTMNMIHQIVGGPDGQAQDRDIERIADVISSPISSSPSKTKPSHSLA